MIAAAVLPIWRVVRTNWTRGNPSTTDEQLGAPVDANYRAALLRGRWVSAEREYQPAEEKMGATHWGQESRLNSGVQERLESARSRVRVPVMLQAELGRPPPGKTTAVDLSRRVERYPASELPASDTTGRSS